MKTTREFVTTTKDGLEVRIIATYVSELTTNPLLANYPTTKRDYISTFGSSMVAYVDGQRINKTSTDPNFWQLIDANGVKKIWGLPIGFAEAEKAEEYNAFLADLMKDDPEVVAFLAEKHQQEVSADVKRCEEVVRLCEMGYMAETAEEIKAKRKQWNDLHNEGGIGYIPTWYTRAEYEHALDFIAKNGN